VTPPVDAGTVRRLLRHEAQVHAIPGRELRDLGDSLLLHDPTDPEPFWNRLEAIDWPSEPAAFDQRLSEIRILFASIGRQPHLWLAPPHDEPADLEARLVANGFEDMGKGLLMIARDDDRVQSRLAALAATPGADAPIERRSGIVGHAAAQVADDIVTVLFDAFAVAEARRASIVAETMASLGDPRFMHYLVRRDGEAVAVARSATFDGLSYLSSIGTVERARGLGLGRIVTASALKDALDAGCEWVHLGVFADNATAIALYERLGFEAAMEPGPDMVLVG
jgi:ribosomal protein S18 acetylase RimI-like enzyme